MGLSEHTRRVAVAEMDTVWALVKAHPEYRPAGLLGGLGILRGLLNLGLTPDGWDELQSYLEGGADGADCDH